MAKEMGCGEGGGGRRCRTLFVVGSSMRGVAGDDVFVVVNG